MQDASVDEACFDLSATDHIMASTTRACAQKVSPTPSKHRNLETNRGIHGLQSWPEGAALREFAAAV